MKNYLSKIVILSLIVILATAYSFGQDGFKVRIAVNSGMFFSEPNSSNSIIDPFAAFNSTAGGLVDFTSDLAFGIEAEVSVPISDKFGIGIEIENAKFSGTNDNPVFYNFFASPFTPLLDYSQQALIYNTEMVNLLGNIRFFPMGKSEFTPFLKLFGGIAFVGTDLRFKELEDQTNIKDPLYSLGTRQTITDEGKFAAPHFGAGAGFEYQVAGNISLYADFSASYIGTDIVNGIPNFSYNKDKAISEHFDVSSITGQISVGLSYTLSGGGSNFKKGGSGKSKGGKTNSKLPFFRRR